MDNCILKVKELKKSYGEVQALKGVDISLIKGQINALLGENGAGKTTLIKIILGFIKQNSGEIIFNTQSIAYLPENPVYFKMTGKDILNLSSYQVGISSSELKEKYTKYAEMINFDLAQLTRKFQTLSTGNRKKFALIQNLIHSPDLLILDEPFNGLDPSSIKKLRELLLYLKNEGKTILISSHIISEAQRTSDNIIILKKGKVLLHESAEKIIENSMFFKINKQKEISLNQFATHIKEKEEAIELIVSKDKIDSLVQYLEREKISYEQAQIDLERLYFMMTE